MSGAPINTIVHQLRKTRIVPFINMVRAFASMFLDEPHRITRDFKSILEKIGKDIFHPSHRMEPFYVASYTLYLLEFMWRNTKLDNKYKLSRYQLLLACRVLINHEDLPWMNSNAMEKYCAKVMRVLWEDEASERLVHAAADVIEKVAAGTFDKDTLRTQPFTEAVIKECKSRPTIGVLGC